MKQKLQHGLVTKTEARLIQLNVAHQRQPQHTFPSKLVVQSKDGIRLIAFDRIQYVKAEGSYARIVVEKESVLMSKSLKRVAEDLLPNSFARCHQSYIVNMERIDEVRTKEVMEVVMDNGVAIPVSRRLLADLKKAIYSFFNNNFKH